MYELVDQEDSQRLHAAHEKDEEYGQHESLQLIIPFTPWTLRALYILCIMCLILASGHIIQTTRAGFGAIKSGRMMDPNEL
jgi:hypothetical protein